MGASGDNPTATAIASTTPAARATRIPMSPSDAVMRGPAPRARSTSPSSALRRTRRAITWPQISSAASPATSPNTPKATASGRMTRSASATMAALVWPPALPPRLVLGTILSTAALTAASCRAASSICNAT